MNTTLRVLFALMAGSILGACQTVQELKSPLSPSQTQPTPASRFYVQDAGPEAFSHRFPDMNSEHRTHFFSGESLFDQNWVTAISSTAARDGLGPFFNARSCAECHFKDGRSRPFDAEGKPTPATLVRLSAADGQAESTYGEQFQPFAVGQVAGEGRLEIQRELIQGHFADGQRYSLEKPLYSLQDLAYGPLSEGALISVRIAPQLAGLGLLERISEAEILKNSDPDDLDQDGISGRPNWLTELRTAERKIGRFGWKANQPSLEQQTAGAFAGDIGISSSLFDSHETDAQFTAVQDQAHGGTPEISDRLLQRVTFYTQNLAVPAPRLQDSEQHQLGERLFSELQCASCHRPHYVLDGEKISPYTDLLLHDMGEELADRRPDGEANGREWRTPPLWGIGLIETVNGHTRYLHDGRARNLEEAVLWHGGEAEASSKSYRELDLKERAALISFLKAL